MYISYYSCCNLLYPFRKCLRNMLKFTVFFRKYFWYLSFNCNFVFHINISPFPPVYLLLSFHLFNIHLEVRVYFMKDFLQLLPSSTVSFWYFYFLHLSEYLSVISLILSALSLYLAFLYYLITRWNYTKWFSKVCSLIPLLFIHT